MTSITIAKIVNRGTNNTASIVVEDNMSGKTAIKTAKKIPPGYSGFSCHVSFKQT